MKINYLREFIAAAQSAQMTDAASFLGISASSLSKHIKSLETELGVPLFARSRKVVLTQYGKSMLSYAQKLVAVQDQYQLEFQCRVDPSVALTIGIPQFQHEEDINQLIEHYQRANLEQMFLVKEAPAPDLCALVLDGTCDLAFVRGTNTLNRTNELIYFPYCVDRLIACLPTSHPCAGQDTVRLSEIGQDTIFLENENSMIYDILANAYAKLGIYPKVSICGVYPSFKNISNGNGITFRFAPPPQSDFGNSMVLIPVDPPIYTYVDIVVRRDRLISQTENFLQYVWRSFPNRAPAVQ